MYVRVPTSVLTVKVMNCSKQIGSSDCGLFAIANAVQLMLNKDPVNVEFEQNFMRKHLHNCFIDRCITPFQSNLRTVRRLVVYEKLYNIYCYCRSIMMKNDAMICCDECLQWYHQKCLDMNEQDFTLYATNKSKSFKCNKCGN
jgi:hypothetical protein